MNIPMESHVFCRWAFISFVYFSKNFYFLTFGIFVLSVVGVLVFNDIAVSEALLFVSPTLWSILRLKVPMSESLVSSIVDDFILSQKPYSVHLPPLRLCSTLSRQCISPSAHRCQPLALSGSDRRKFCDSKAVVGMTSTIAAALSTIRPMLVFLIVDI